MMPNVEWFREVTEGMTIRDTIVIYWSEDDECYVAHSLRMDQLGMGESIVEAMAELMHGIDGILRLAAQDKSIRLFRDAPPEVVALAERARSLPREIYEVAHKKARGQWPDDLDVDLTTRGDRRASFKTEVEETVAC